jgi:hypothetical protein
MLQGLRQVSSPKKFYQQACETCDSGPPLTFTLPICKYVRKLPFMFWSSDSFRCLGLRDDNILNSDSGTFIKHGFDTKIQCDCHNYFRLVIIVLWSLFISNTIEL